MSIIYFILTYLLLLILLPIRLIINLITRFLFKPFKVDYSYFQKAEAEDIDKFYDKILKQVKQNLKHAVYHGDGCKYIGLLYSVLPQDEDIKKAFKGYVKDGLFLRKQNNQTYDKGNYSSDMFAGYFVGLYTSYINKEFDTDEEFKQELIKAIDNALFNKPYFQFKSQYKEIDRGYLFKYFFMNAGHFLPILAMLEIAYKITNNKKYKLLYFLILPLATIDILVNPTFAIRFKNYRYMQWCYVHSNFIYYYYLYKLTNNPIYKYGYKFIYKRFPFNPEFAILMNDKKTAYLWLMDYIHKDKNKIYNIDIPKQKVKNIKDLIKRNSKEYEEYTKILSPSIISNDYLWEKALNEYQFYISPTTGIDFIRIYHLIKDTDK